MATADVHTDGENRGSPKGWLCVTMIPRGWRRRSLLHTPSITRNTTRCAPRSDGKEIRRSAQNGPDGEIPTLTKRNPLILNHMMITGCLWNQTRGDAEDWKKVASQAPVLEELVEVLGRSEL